MPEFYRADRLATFANAASPMTTAAELALAIRISGVFKRCLADVTARLNASLRTHLSERETRASKERAHSHQRNRVSFVNK